MNMSQPSPRNVRLSAQLVMGLVLALLGVLFTLDNLHVVDARDYLQYWPAALVVFGVVQIAQRRPARVFIGTTWVLVGSVMLGVRLHLLPYHVFSYWPVLLVLIGGYIAWQAATRNSLIRAGDDAERLTVVAVMGGGDRRVISRTFQGGELTAIMGGGQVDFRDAGLAGRDAILDVFTIMGGFEIRVPETWSVVIEVIPFMGGCEDKTRPPADPGAPRLIVRGFVMMGGIEFKN